MPEPEESAPESLGDQPGPSTSKTGARKRKGGKEGVEDGSGEESQPLLSEVFIDRDIWKLEPSQLVLAEYQPLGLREENEKDYYFVPSIKTGTAL